MNNHETDDRIESAVIAGLNEQFQILAAEIEEHDDGPTECTVYPPDATENERVTRWITAREGSFVALEEMR